MSDIAIDDPEARLKSIAAIKAQHERMDRLFADPNLLDVICANVANGGSLISLAQLWGIPYGHLTNFIRKHQDFDRRYQAALKDRQEWMVERVLLEVRRIGLRDARRMFNDEGGLLQPSQWSDEDAATVASFEVEELFDGFGKDRVQIGHTKKVKFHDKNKSLEYLLKNLGQLIDRAESNVSLTLEQLVAQSFNKPRVVSDSKE